VAGADDDGAVLDHHRAGSGEARQAVGYRVNRLMQRCVRPVRQRRPLEIRDRVETPSSSTAAMNGTLFGDPRPGLPACTPPR